MRIGLDFDGTIAAWGGAMARWMQENGRAPFDPDRHVVDQVSGEHLHEMVRAILATSLTLAMEPMDGALDAMRRLRAHHDLYVVTARNTDEGAWARRWIAQHAVPVTDVVETARASKADACRRLDLDVLLDDTPSALADLPAAGTLPVLLESRFRRDEPRDPALRIVDHWHDFEALCAALATPAGEPRR
jgi:uncharacterized HAD superfamily protein